MDHSKHKGHPEAKKVPEDAPLLLERCIELETLLKEIKGCPGSVLCDACSSLIKKALKGSVNG